MIIVFILLYLIAVSFPVSDGYTTPLSYCDTRWPKKAQQDSVITFIVPSVSRPSLTHALRSVLAMNNSNWLIIVVFDGLLSNHLYLNASTQLPVYFQQLPTEIMHNERICYIHGPTNRVNNCGGGLRNYAIKFVTTKWIGFLDDDDVLDPMYIDYLLEHERTYPNASAVLFRMCHGYFDAVLPPPQFRDVLYGHMGISYAVQSSIFHEKQFQFRPSNVEDFMLLYNLKINNLPIVISPYLVYYVKNYTSPACLKPSLLTYLENRREESLKQRIPKEVCQRTYRGTISTPNFVFTEMSSAFFASNIEGLKHSLQKAIDNRCIGVWKSPSDQPIHVIFDANEKPISPLYIQVQLEQRNTFHFSPAYLQKLEQAVQVWEFNPIVGSLPNSTKIPYFVPTMLMLSHPPVYACHRFPSIFSFPMNQSHVNHHQHELEPLWTEEEQRNMWKQSWMNTYVIYRRGFYHGCQVDKQGQIKYLGKNPSPCRAASNQPSEYCYLSENEDSGIDGLRLCTQALSPSITRDILMFGKLRNSQDNSREQICDELLTANPNKLVFCIEGIFATILQHVVCTTRVVVVSHYFRSSGLETHRIDPLLQVHRVVLAASSDTSPVVDRIYRNAIPVVPKALLANTTRDILANYTHWLHEHKYHQHRHEFVAKASTTLDPLCMALSQLEDAIRVKLNKPLVD